MNELAWSVLLGLARTTALLSVAVAALYLLIRFGHLHSPHRRRVLTVLALLQAVIWFQVPLVVPWYEPATPASDAPQPVAAEHQGNFAATDEPLLPIGAPVVVPIQVERAEPPAVPIPREKPPTAMQWGWPLLVFGVWACGILAIVGVSFWRYVAFVRAIGSARPLEPHWQCEFDESCSLMNVARRPRLQANNALGPLLCWTPRGSLLLVPAGLWRDLTGAQRQAVLRHEIAHFKRHDPLKSLLIRVLAIPHWFNPLAWWAVREFEEAGEWICDDLAAGQPATEYARALVRLCEMSSPVAWPTTAARGSGVAARVRRLLDTQTKEDSIMKKLFLAAIAIALLTVGAVRVELVAQALPDAVTTSPDSTPQNPQRAAKFQAMADAAQKTYDAVDELFMLGTGSHTEVYVWSSYIRSAQVRVAASRDERIKASQKHLDRMQNLHKKVAALQREQARGGEADKFHATQFYVAEAELFLLETKNNESAPALHPKGP
jgi:beta-lactamase regulating signal transducer with metallopeptidase domain